MSTVALGVNEALIYAICLWDTPKALSLVVTTIENAGTVLKEASASHQILRFMIPTGMSVCAQTSHHTILLGEVSHVESVKAPLAGRATSTERLSFEHMDSVPAALLPSMQQDWQLACERPLELIRPESPPSQTPQQATASLISPKARAGILYPMGSLQALKDLQNSSAQAPKPPPPTNNTV